LSIHTHRHTQQKLRIYDLNLSKIAVGLSVFTLLSVSLAESRGLLDYFHSSAPRAKHERRAGAISQNEALALYSATQRRASFDACADQFPAAKPLDLALVPATMKPIALCSDNFAVMYSQTSKTPLIVVERLNAVVLRDAQGEQRSNKFYADPRIPVGGRADLSDYRGQQQRLDRGHQAPAADAPNQRAMAQTFSLSNMVPQDPVNNRKVWAKVESDVRKFTLRAEGNVFVFTGPIFDVGHDTIGKNKVWVPTRLFKLVYDDSSKLAWAYVLPNAEARIGKPMDYSTFVDTTGLHPLDGVPVLGTVRRSVSKN
jgi:endonuclease G